MISVETLRDLLKTRMLLGGHSIHQPMVDVDQLRTPSDREWFAAADGGVVQEYRLVAFFSSFLNLPLVANSLKTVYPYPDTSIVTFSTSH